MQSETMFALSLLHSIVHQEWAEDDNLTWAMTMHHCDAETASCGAREQIEAFSGAELPVFLSTSEMIRNHGLMQTYAELQIESCIAFGKRAANFFGFSGDELLSVSYFYLPNHSQPVSLLCLPQLRETDNWYSAEWQQFVAARVVSHLRGDCPTPSLADIAHSTDRLLPYTSASCVYN